MSEVAPWFVDSSTLGESNTKAFLLVQAHLFGLQLPILDYINDTKSVLDQVCI
jgi:activating signal cointegrator complex subunit 3